MQLLVIFTRMGGYDFYRAWINTPFGPGTNQLTGRAFTAVSFRPHTPSLETQNYCFRWLKIIKKSIIKNELRLWAFWELPHEPNPLPTWRVCGFWKSFLYDEWFTNNLLKNMCSFDCIYVCIVGVRLLSINLTWKERVDFDQKVVRFFRWIHAPPLWGV